MIYGAELILPIKEIMTAQWNGDAIIGTDGSVRDENGTYGVVILINLYLPEPTVAV